MLFSDERRRLDTAWRGPFGPAVCRPVCKARLPFWHRTQTLHRRPSPRVEGDGPRSTGRTSNRDLDVPGVVVVAHLVRRGTSRTSDRLLKTLRTPPITRPR